MNIAESHGGHLSVDQRSPQLERLDYVFLGIGVCFSFFLASTLMTGWPEGILPNLKHPFIYNGDGLFQFWLGQRAIEGWIFDNPRSGFPFGSSFLDYPGSDSGNLLLLKILGKISGSYFAAANLYLLLGFSAAFAAGFLVFRKINLDRKLAFSAAILFAFLPYHFSRLLMGHTFYTWYFVVPIYFYIGLRVFQLDRRPISVADLLKYSTLLAFSACFGVYFAFFGAITVAICGASGFLREKNSRALLISFALLASICLAVLVNVTPNLVNSVENGKNTEVAQRIPVETEMYALKLVHLLLPYEMHRSKSLRNFTQNYNKTFPLSNTVSSLGVIGILGFMSILLSFFRSSAGLHQDHRMSILTLLTLLLLVTSTVGGLNVLFSTLISPMIRGWDRISIFIAFFSIAAFFITIEQLLKSKKVRPLTIGVISLCIMGLGVIDQTATPSYNASLTSKTRFLQDQKFIGSIEKLMPKGAAIYQLPYIPFPEEANLVNLGTYDLLVGFLNSENLHWSAGGMRGREADLFYRALSKQPVADQLKTIKSMGFSGIYIDKRGYQDSGQAIVEEIIRLVGPAAREREDGAIVFFALK